MKIRNLHRKLQEFEFGVAVDSRNGTTWTLLRPGWSHFKVRNAVETPRFLSARCLAHALRGCRGMGTTTSQPGLHGNSFELLKNLEFVSPVSSFLFHMQNESK